MNPIFMKKYVILFLDCSSPFTVTFITNSEAVENPAATTAQRGKFTI